jgi:hypothetical protein
MSEYDTSMNSTRQIARVLLTGLQETQTLGELDRDFTKGEAKEYIQRLEQNKATGCDGIPVDVWKMFCAKLDGAVILINVLQK